MEFRGIKLLKEKYPVLKLKLPDFSFKNSLKVLMQQLTKKIEVKFWIFYEIYSIRQLAP